MAEEPYNQLLKDLKRELVSDAFPVVRKKRKKAKEESVLESVVVLTSPELLSEYKVSDSDDDSFDSDDFEDVDLVDNSKLKFDVNITENNPSTDNFTISINTGNAAKKPSKKVNIIGAEERKFRKVYHQLYLATMILHGSLRNQWCNDYKTMMELKAMVPSNVIELVFQRNDKKVINSVKSRRFLDGIRILMELYRKRFKVTSKGIIRKNWNELSIPQTNTERNVTFEKFKNLLTSFKGSRDIGGQGFVCLLRSIGLKARLVFSLQPPDFTLAASFDKIEIPKASSENNDNEMKPQRQKFRGNSKSAFLSDVRQSLIKPTVNTYTFEDAPFPVFWTEVWNKYSKKWISVDPIVLQWLEYAPMRRKSRFEPPSSQERNQLVYVIAYDEVGGVKDVTRRYSQYYNAKTIKKKIIFRSEEDEEWYKRVLRAVENPIRTSKTTNSDILELKEFRDRDLAEGMPNNLNDFKNHPIYALECQLKQSEIIYPKNESSKCGTFRNKSFGRKKESQQEVFQVYKRSCVHSLKSVKAWFFRGRVLKIGEQPLKIKRNKPNMLKSGSLNQETHDGNDQEEVTRLYAEFQTNLYIPPPIIDGKIPKNAFGNIEIYTATMIPENGYLLKTSPKYTMKLAEKAARLLDIDFARAIVAFDFGNRSGGKRKHNKIPTVREGGIVIDQEYREALIAVLDYLLDEEEELQRERVELNSLKNWMLILRRLRISDRLNKVHGEVGRELDSNINSQDSDHSKDDLEEEKMLETNNAVVENHFGGGFLLENDVAQHQSESNYQSDEEDSMSGGFVPNDNSYSSEVQTMGQMDNDENSVVSGDESYMGGFVPDDNYGNVMNAEVSDELQNSDGDEKFSDELYGGGGFILADTEEIEGALPTTNQLNNFDKSGGLDLVEKPRNETNTVSNNEEIDIPDDFFKFDQNGELIYDPSNAINNTDNADNANNTDIEKEKQAEDRSLNVSDNEVMIEEAKQSESLQPNVNRLERGDNTLVGPNSIDRADSHISNEYESEDNIAVVDENEKDSTNISPIDEAEIAAQEEAFDFEYSDDSE